MSKFLTVVLLPRPMFLVWCWIPTEDMIWAMRRCDQQVPSPMFWVSLSLCQWHPRLPSSLSLIIPQLPELWFLTDFTNGRWQMKNCSPNIDPIIFVKSNRDKSFAEETIIENIDWASFSKWISAHFFTSSRILKCFQLFLFPVSYSLSFYCQDCLSSAMKLSSGSDL